MKKFTAAIITTIALSWGCATETVIQDKRPPLEIDKLSKFFLMCESDIKNAVKVVVEKDLVKSLTHLQIMDPGGKKYYLLERETISNMIKAVTYGIYTDLVLINKKGVIIYTMFNDDIFGRNVRTYLNGSAVHRCYQRCLKTNMHVEDISIFPPITGKLNLFISVRDRASDDFSGVFIMQVNIKMIEDIIKKDTIVIDQDGKYRISGDREKFLTNYPLFNKIDLTNVNKNEINQFVNNNKTYSYYPFSFKNLNWIVVTEDQGRP